MNSKSMMSGERQLMEQWRQLTLLLNNIATCHHKLGRHIQALGLYQEALCSRMEVLKAPPARSSSYCNTLQARIDQALRDHLTLQDEVACQGRSSRKSNRFLDFFQGPKDSSDTLFQSTTIFTSPLTSAPDTHAIESAITLYNMGLLHFEMNDLTKAMRLLHMVTDIEPDPLTSAMTLICIAQIQYIKRLPHAAMLHLTKALYIEQSLLRSIQKSSCLTAEPHPELDRCVTITLSLMGRIQHFHGSSNKALQLCHEAITLLQNTYESDSLEVAVMLYNIGRIYHVQGNFNEATSHMSSLLVMVSENLSHYSEWLPQIAVAFQTYGLIHLDNGSTFEAIEHFTQSLEIRREVFGATNICVAETLILLGHAYFESGHLEDALQVFHEATTIPMKEEQSATILCHIGHVYHTKGNLDQALSSYKDALVHVLTALHRQSECIMDLLAIIGGLYMELGLPNDATIYIAEANEIHEQLRLHNQTHPGKKYFQTCAMIHELLGFHPAAPAA